MSLYQFNEIYYRVTGEYENDIQILFLHSDASDMMVFDCGCYYLVNKSANIYLADFQRYLNKREKTYTVLRIVEKRENETYILLEGALIKIAWHFSTAAGQQVKDFALSTQEEHTAYYTETLQCIDGATEVIPTDLRFTSPLT
jgi:hypothetical protein